MTPNAVDTTLLVVAGIRSQYIKLAALQKGVRAWNQEQPNSRLKLVSVNSGQHWSESLSRQYLDEYGVTFDVDFSGQYSSTEPNAVLGEMITHLSRYLATQVGSIDAVAVFGDANTTLAGAIAARRAPLPLIHIEAGLRTCADTPEEMNRIVADHLASLHLVSSRADMANLRREGLSESAVFTGDVVRDLFVNLSRDLPQRDASESFVLVTLHRAENTRDDSVIERIFTILDERGLQCLFMAHPRLLERMTVAAEQHPRVTVRESCGHGEMACLLSECSFVITDSGALQREAFYVKRRAVIVQDEPFWRSLTETGIHLKTASDLSSLRKSIDWAVAASVEDFPAFDDFGDPPVSRLILRHIVDFVGTARARASSN